MSRWPDPERPGVPPEHNRHGVWFLRLPPAPEPEPMIWTPAGRGLSLGYWMRLGHDEVIVAPSEFLPGGDYAAAEFHGAGLTPAEAQALAAERDALRTKLERAELTTRRVLIEERDATARENEALRAEVQRARAEEREACAREAEAEWCPCRQATCPPGVGTCRAVFRSAREIAAAIRARGEAGR